MMMHRNHITSRLFTTKCSARRLIATVSYHSFSSTSASGALVPVEPADPVAAFKQYLLKHYTEKGFGKTPFYYRGVQQKHTASAPWKPGPNSSLKRPPVASKVLIVGSGGLSIGQAGEFDYSGMSSRPLLH